METDKEKLTLKELAGYLPYGLKIRMNNTCNVYKVNGLKRVDGMIKILLFQSIDLYTDECKPILRPLYDLTKEIEVNGKKFVPCDILFSIDSFDIIAGYNSKKYAEEFISSKNIMDICYDYVFWQKLQELHFDIHGLIERGLAININDLPNE